MARTLAEGLTCLPGVTLRAQPEANSVFVDLPAAMQARLQEAGGVFYRFIGEGGARLVCSWASRPDDVEAFLACAQA